MASFGLVGHPVGHSMSKLMHEAVFESLGLDHSYDLYDVLPADLKEFIESADHGGLNVTIPHKIDVIEFLDSLSREASLIGSVNTIEFKDGLIGHNTDVYGFMKACEIGGVDVRGKDVLVLGAGGAGRGIAYKLAMEGAHPFIFDIDQGRARNLADEICQKTGFEAYTVGSIREFIVNAEILVNASPVGMHPKTDISPVDPMLLRPELAVVDIVYNPTKTRLISDAQKIGAKTVSGVGMLVHQGAQALRIWLGIDPPIEVMEEAVLKNL